MILLFVQNQHAASVFLSISLLITGIDGFVVITPESGHMLTCMCVLNKSLMKLHVCVASV